MAELSKGMSAFSSNLYDNNISSKNTSSIIVDPENEYKAISSMSELQLPPSRKKKPLKEKDLFPPLKSFFEEQGYQVYAEVPYGGPTADIIAKKGNICIIVEMKVSLSLKLIEQVCNWRSKAHLIYAAVPQRTEITLFARNLLKQEGIGLLVLDIDNSYEGDPYCSSIYKLVKPKLYRGPLTVKWDQHIIPEYSQNVAGVQHADIRVSRYKLMMKHVKRLIERHENGISINELIDSIDTYYANPKQGLFNALKKYESDWCEPFKKPNDRETYFRLKSRNLLNQDDIS